VTSSENIGIALHFTWSIPTDRTGPFARVAPLEPKKSTFLGPPAVISPQAGRVVDQISSLSIKRELSATFFLFREDTKAEVGECLEELRVASFMISRKVESVRKMNRDQLTRHHSTHKMSLRHFQSCPRSNLGRCKILLLSQRSQTTETQFFSRTQFCRFFRGFLGIFKVPAEK
jgi:hypothetical protein